MILRKGGNGHGTEHQDKDWFLELEVVLGKAKPPMVQKKMTVTVEIRAIPVLFRKLTPKGIS